MLWASSAGGQVPARRFALPLARSDSLDVRDDALAAALEFWGRAADDGRLSDGIRVVCSTSAHALRSA
jgi:hypothetical protein